MESATYHTHVLQDDAAKAMSYEDDGTFLSL